MKEKKMLIIGFGDEREAAAAIGLFRAAGIRASANSEDLRKGSRFSLRGKSPVYIYSDDAEKADAVLDAAREFSDARKRRKKISLPPEEGTLEYLDMLVYDCRQYLMIAAGEIQSIEEEGSLALDEPTNDPKKIMLRLRRLKSQCMSVARKKSLDWEHHGGLGID